MDLNKKNVTIDPALAKVIGEQQAGSRIFRAEGDNRAYVAWWDALSQTFPRGLVSPGGAAPYAGVSRAAVHKAIHDGRLTVFSFAPHQERRGIFGSKVVRSNPYLYLPVAELKLWRLELEERIGHLRADGATIARVQKQLQRELEGEKPDWKAYFLDEHPDGRIVKGRR